MEPCIVRKIEASRKVSLQSKLSQNKWTFKPVPDSAATFKMICDIK